MGRGQAIGKMVAVDIKARRSIVSAAQDSAAEYYRGLLAEKDTVVAERNTTIARLRRKYRDLAKSNGQLVRQNQALVETGRADKLDAALLVNMRDHVAGMERDLAAVRAKLARLEQLENVTSRRALRIRQGLYAVTKLQQGARALRTECRSESESQVEDAIDGLLETLKSVADALLQPIETRMEVDNPPPACPHGFKDCPQCADENDVAPEIEEDDDAGDGEKGQG